MDQIQEGPLDQAAFQRVWSRVMPEDRPDCPFTVDPPPSAPLPAPAPPCPASPPPCPAQPPVCLGEDSGNQLAELEALACACADGYRIYRALARRYRKEPLFLQLAQRKRRQAGRLAAAYFLISGRRFTAPPTQAPRADDLPLLLRDRVQAEHRLSLRLFTAATATADPCLVELYRDLGKECQTCAAQIRGWLEEEL